MWRGDGCLGWAHDECAVRHRGRRRRLRMDWDGGSLGGVLIAVVVFVVFSVVGTVVVEVSVWVVALAFILGLLVLIVGSFDMFEVV